MKYKIIVCAVASIILFVGGWIAGYYNARPTVTGITVSDVNWSNGVVNTDVNNLDCETAKTELQKYYTSEPTLEFLQKDNEITVVAGLVDRKWSRSLKLNFKKPENMIFGGIGRGFNDNYSAHIGYLKLLGSIGIGADVIGNNTGIKYAGIICSVLL